MLKEILEQGQRTIDQALERLLPAATQQPESIQAFLLRTSILVEADDLHGRQIVARRLPLSSRA